VPGRRKQTLRSKYLLSCYRNYRRAYLFDLNHFYSGLNALAWITIAVELMQVSPEIWVESFETDEEADVEKKKLIAQRTQLVESVGLSLESNRAQAKDGGADIWLAISQADYKFLTSRRPQVAAAEYSRALADASLFEADSARGQLEVYKDLDLFPDR